MAQEFHLPAMQMREVHMAYRYTAEQLVHAVEEITGSTPARKTNLINGVSWRYGGESLMFAESPEAAGGVRHIAAADETGTTFELENEWGRKLPVAFDRGGGMVGNEITNFRRWRAGVRSGALLGSHEIFVEKKLTTYRDTDGEATLQASITRTSTGEGIAPPPILDLRLLRTNPPRDRRGGDFTVIQSHRVEIGSRQAAIHSVRVGDTLAVENYIQPIPGDPNSQGATVYPDDHFSTASRLQQTYHPRIMLDERLAEPTWQQLVMEPLSVLDLMRARNV